MTTNSSRFTKVNSQDYVDLTKVTAIRNLRHIPSGRNSLDLYILSNSKPILVSDEHYDTVCHLLGITPLSRSCPSGVH